MNRVLDFALGLPGLVVFIVLIIALFAAAPSNGPNSKELCEAQGGKYVQTMKSYHTCKMPK